MACYLNRFNGTHSILSIISLILIFVVVLAMAYFASKFAAKYQSNVLNGKSNIKIIESFRIGTNKLIVIAKIEDNYYALGVGKDEITLIDKLDHVGNESDDSSLNASDKKVDFKEILSKIKKNDSNDE